jgi:hypothetical protein
VAAGAAKKINAGELEHKIRRQGHGARDPADPILLSMPLFLI